MRAADWPEQLKGLSAHFATGCKARLARHSPLRDRAALGRRHLTVDLALFIDVAGDLAVLRYRNAVGLAIGRIYLNAVFVGYVVGV